MDRLFIEDKEIELGANTVISLSLQINDLGDLVDRQANYTNQFKIPVTGKNREVLKNSELLNITSGLPYKRLKAKVFKDGLEVISDGYAILDTYNGEYNITVYGGLVDFFKLLDGKKLSDLDLSQYAHLYTVNNAVNSFQNNSGYIYGLVKNGIANISINNTGDIRHDRTLPWMFIHTLVQKIVEGVGFSVTGSILNNYKYSRSVIQLGSEKWTTNPRILHAQNLTDQGGASPPGLATLSFIVQFNDSSSGDATRLVGNYDSLSILSGAQDVILPTVPSGTLTAPQEFNLKYTVHYSILTGAAGGGYIVLEIWQFSPSRVVGSKIIHNIQPGLTTTGITTIEIQPGTYNSGDSFKLEASFFPYNPGASQRCTLIIQQPTTVECELIDAPMVYGAPVHPNLNLPDWTQTDFLKSVAHIFGIIYKPNSNIRQLRMESLETIVNNIPYAHDWTDKMHMETNKDGMPSYQANFKLGRFAQNNYLRYTHDDEVPVTLGDGLIQVNNNHLQDEVTLLQTDFGASANEYITAWDNYAMYIPRFDANGYISDKIAPRIAMVELVNLPSGIKWDDTSPITASLSVSNNVPLFRFINPLYSSNMGFDNSLIDEYYSLYKRITILPVTLTIKAKLNQYDIANLDHFTPIYLRQFGAYFYVNKVSNYQSPNKLTSVELIKINTFTEQPSETSIEGLFLELICNGKFNSPFPNNESNAKMQCWNDAPFEKWYSTNPGSQMNYQGIVSFSIRQKLTATIYSGGKYKVSFTVRSYTDGTLECVILDSGLSPIWTIPTTAVTNGLVYAVFTFTGSESFIQFNAAAYFNGIIDDVSIMRIA